eukprot:COSAG01_NODE_34753_length_542_cov_3.731377_1_plen_169_part_10
MVVVVVVVVLCRYGHWPSATGSWSSPLTRVLLVDVHGRCMGVVGCYTWQDIRPAVERLNSGSRVGVRPQHLAPGQKHTLHGLDPWCGALSDSARPPHAMLSGWYHGGVWRGGGVGGPLYLSRKLSVWLPVSSKHSSGERPTGCWVLATSGVRHFSCAAQPPPLPPLPQA